jgi:hypothetical protein
MWICFNNAFISIVADQRSDGLMVRARKREHLVNLFGKRAKIIETPPPADYRWRTIATRKQVADLLVRQVDELSYVNFKHACVDRKLHDLYLGFWSDHYRYQEEDTTAQGGAR